MAQDKSLIISKLIGGGSLDPLDADFRLVADLLSLRRAAERRTQAPDDNPDTDGRHHVGGHPRPLPKEQYDALLRGRQQLMQTALCAVRALMDYDRDVLPLFLPQEAPATTTTADLSEAVRAAAAHVTRKGDWAALYMLLRERGLVEGYADVVRLVAAYAPEAPQPVRQDIAAAEWNTHRRRFPDWQPDGVRYDKFRRHYLVAQAALPLLPS